MLYKLIPEIKEYIWAGKKLKEKYNKKTSLEKVSETWELSTNKNGISKILVDGNEISLKKFIEENDVLGLNFDKDELNILIKMIDSDDNLSIQVHPSDAYAENKSNSLGKSEMWYVVEAEEDACLYVGFNKDTSLEEVREAINNNTIVSFLNKIYVKPGEAYYIPAGTVHAIGKGITVVEIQENSDITYRLYDYDRIGKDGKKRELHIEDSLNVLNYNKYEPSSTSKQINDNLKLLESNKYFEAYHLKTLEPYEYINNQNSFLSITAIDDTKINDIVILKGESYFVEPNTKLNIEFGEVIMARYPKHYLGIDLGGTSIKGAIVNDLGITLINKKIPTESEKGYEQILNNLCTLIKDLAKKFNVELSEIEPIGICLPGTIDSNRGMIVYSNNIKLKNCPIRHDLEERLHVSIEIENDANGAALGELYFGSLKGKKNAVLLTLGTGVGSGIIIDSKLYKGGFGTVTEIGHMKIKDDGYRCTCGGYGCFESLLSLARLRYEVDKELDNPNSDITNILNKDYTTPLVVFDRISESKAAEKIVKKYIKNLTNGIVNIINILSPEAIIIGGGVSFRIEKYLKEIEETVNRFKFGGLMNKKTKIYKASLGNEAGIYGAVSLVIRK